MIHSWLVPPGVLSWWSPDVRVLSIAILLILPCPGDPAPDHSAALPLLVVTVIIIILLLLLL